MKIFKKNDRYIVVNMTGNKNNYLSIKFGDKKNKIIFRNLENKVVDCNIDSDLILVQVEKALSRIKDKYKLEFYITDIEFVSSDSFSVDIYEKMAFTLLSNIITNDYPELCVTDIQNKSARSPTPDIDGATTITGKPDGNKLGAAETGGAILAIGDAKEGSYTNNPDGSITGPSGGRLTSTGKFDGSGNEIYQRGSGGYYVIDDKGVQQTAISPNEHGNTLGNQPTEIYQKYDAEGNYLKTGISQNANTRYTDAEIDGGEVRVIGERPRNKAVQTERNITERNPGPDNKESWAGKRDPSHPNYDPNYVPPHIKNNND